VWRRCLNWIQNVTALLVRRKPGPTDRGMLVGLYLNQANRSERSRTRGADHQQRREGRFAQNRQRG
jgi:hypothetical protein